MSVPPEPVAIIGSGCRFPGGANTPSKFWELVQNPRDLLQKVPPKRRFHPEAYFHDDPEHHGSTNVQASYFLDEDPAEFDNGFFNIQPAESEAVDPQQRILLETIYDALCAGGQTLKGLRGSSTAVMVGMMCDDWGNMMNKDWESLPQYSATGVARSIMSNRVSYFMDWHGPSMTLDTACSSSLVAVHLAVQALRNGESRVAVAAGANLILNPGMYIAESNLHMLSPSGRSRMWDRDADGYARGEGIAAVVLKTLSAALEDGDPIECIIRNTGVNQDGKTKGLTMPSATAQAALIQSTYARAGLDINKAADRPQFFHAHGTGTPAGDPQESQAIAEAFFSNEASSDKLYVGSVKTIIGHTEGTAGLASLISSSLALQHGIVPPNMHFNNLSPGVAPFYDNLEIPTAAKPWPKLVPGQPRRVSVNSFGFGGTNAHAIIESYETPVAENVPGPSFTPLVVSAANERSLRSLIASYSTFLDANPEVSLQDFSHTLQAGRSTLPYRAHVAAYTSQQASQKLDALLTQEDAADLRTRHFEVSSPRVLAVFTGQGAQWPRMGAELIETSPFASKRMDDLDAALASLPSGDRPEWTLRNQILADKTASRVAEASVSQPLCTALQIVLVDLLRVAGIDFQAAVGHSSGEIAAAYAAGLLSDSDAIRVAYYRGLHAKLAKSTSGTKGAMMAVGTSFADGVEFCELEDFSGKLQVAAHNSPSSITLSGDEDAIASALEIFQDEGTFARQLKVDTAYHSKHMSPCSGPYLASMKAIIASDMRPNDGATLPIWHSSVFEGHRMSSSDVLPDYWVKNMTQTVLFAPAVAAAAADGPFDLCLEIGPHAALKGPCLDVLQEAQGERPPYSGVLSRGKDDILEFSNALGMIWSCLGAGSVSFEPFQQTVSGHKAKCHMLADLPAYPFDHSKTFWSMSRISGGHAVTREPPHPILGRRCVDRESVQDIHWRNILRPKEISWLQGHRIQGQIVFPAAGYVAMVIEAMKILATKSSISLISIENLVLGRAMAFDDEDASIETSFSITILRSNNHSISARFSCSSAPAKQSESLLTVNAEGEVTVELGTPELDKLLFVETEQFNMTDLQVDRFYSQLSKLQYEYSPPFRGMLSIKRKLGYAAGTLEDQAGSSWEDQLLVHPGMLDTAIQSALAAFSCPGDGRMREMYVPVGIQSIIINPYFTSHGGGKQDVLSWEALARGYKNSRSTVDISIASQDNAHTFIQIEAMELAPFAAARAENDVVMFSKIEYNIDAPNGDLVVVDDGFTADDIDMATNSDRVSFYYLRRLVESITPEERAHALPHYQSLLTWATKVVTRAKTGKNPFVPSSCQDDTEEQIDAIASMMDIKHERADIRLLQSVGRNLPHVVRTGAGILEYMTEDGLFEFYDTGLGLDIANRQVARMAAQLIHRYPHMDILEIGAGTGGTTRNVLPLLGPSFSSYTYTDISSGFFDAAKGRFQDYSSRMNFQTFDMERPPAAQELVEGSYDLVLGANVLHATDKLDLMMTHVRQLLKPGGWLIALEIESHDNLRTGLTMGCFPGWWAGAGKGRDDGPALTLPQWDSLLQKCGFGGVETSTPLLHKLYGSVVFAAQAVDDRVSLLRAPLSSKDVLQPAGGPPLIVIGGQTLPVHRIAEQVKGYLAPYFSSIVRVASLEDLGDTVAPTSSIISLSELDSPLFDNITPSRFEALKNVWRYARNILWVTRGSKAETPHSFMTVGLGRVLQFEHPNISLEILDLDTVDSGTPQTVAQELLRLEYIKKWERDGQGRELLWSFENEVHIESGSRMIPRVRKSEQANARFNSSRRAIAAQVHQSPIHFASNEQSLYELQIPSPLLISNVGSAINGTTTLRVSHFLLQIIQVAQYGRLMLCAGTDETTGHRVLAFSPVTQSRPAVPSDWTVSLEDVSPFKAIAAVASNITASNILALAPAGSTILIHEPDESVAKALTRQAQASSNHVVITSSRKGQVPEGWRHIHGKLSQRSVVKILPRSPALFVDLSQAPSSTEAGQLITKSLEPACVVYGSEDFYGTSARVRAGAEHGQVTQTLKIAWAAAADEIHSQDEASCPVLELQRVPGFSVVESPLTIADCTDASSVSANLRPIDSGEIFRADRTYLLIGLAGDVGQSLCQWMVEHGARYIVMASRNPKVSTMFIRSMEALGATIVISTLDITSRESLYACYENVCKTLPPIAGVANGAMVLEDTLFDNLSFDTMNKVLQPKVLGSQLLDELFHDTPLEFFILFSSITGIIGNSGQSPYIAANMFMTALAAQRRQRGVVGSAIAIASLIGIGYVERDEHLTGEHFERYGTKNISEQDLHQLFAEGILIGRPGCSESTELITGLEPWFSDAPEKPQFFADIKFQHLLVQREGAQLDAGKVLTAPVRVQLAAARSREAARLIVQDSFMSRLKRILMLSAEDEIGEKASLVEQGLDSLMAVEVRSWFLKELEVDVPVLKILSGISIPDLLAHALERVPATIIKLETLPENDIDLAGAARESESDMPRKESPPQLEAERASSTASIDDRDRSSGLGGGDSGPGSGSRSPPSTEPSVSENDGEEVKTGPLAGQDDSGTSAATVTGETVTPMSYGQSRFWFLSDYLPDKTSFDMTVMLKLKGKIQARRMEQAVQTIAHRHEALRTRFFWSGEGDQRVAVQGVLPESHVRLVHKTVASEVEASAELAKLHAHVWELGSWESAKVILLTGPDDTHYLIVGGHHISWDGYSFTIMFLDLDAAYTGKPLPPLGPESQYPTFSTWQTDMYETGGMAREIDEWRTVIPQDTPPLPLFPFARSQTRPILDHFFQYEEKAVLAKPLVTKLKQIARKNGSTMCHLYLGALKALVFRLLPEIDDCFIGLADANRIDKRFMGSLGFFLNLLPIPFSRGPPRTKISDLVKDASDRAFGSLARSVVPWNVILKELKIPRTNTCAPIFQLFVDYRQIVQERPTWAGCKLVGEEWLNARNGYDLTLGITDNVDESLLSLRFQANIYDEASTKLFMRSYVHVLETFAEGADLNASALPCWAPSDIATAIQAGKGPSMELEWPLTVSHRIDQMIQEHAGDPALKDGLGNSLTYLEMGHRINAIAAVLLKAGATTGARIGVFQDPSADCICSMLAILRVGATYIPLDRRNSMARLVSVVQEARPSIIVSDRYTRSDTKLLGASDATEIVVSDIPTTSSEIASPTPNLAQPRSPAIILFTSGTTGKPKGILLTHSNLRAQSEGYSRSCGIPEKASVVLQQTIHSFDVSLDQIFAALADGGCLVVVPADKRGDPRAVTQMMIDHGVTYTVATPSEYGMWFRHARENLAQCSSWRAAFGGGEHLHSKLIQEFTALALPGLTLHNNYGPTEASLAITKGEVDYRDPHLEGHVPAGFILPNYQVIIVDEQQLDPVPLGVPGEIVVGGPGVAAGYLGPPEMTAEKFINGDKLHQSAGKGTWYRTGDKGHLRDDGALYVHGRIAGDFQVKIRGFRVEVAEIEAVMLATAKGAMTRAVVTARGSGEDRFLAAHVVWATDHPQALRGEMVRRLQTELPLPSYMQPAVIVSIESVPVTRNFKVDRRAIQALELPDTSGGVETGATAADVVATSTEQKLAQLWRSVISHGVGDLTSETSFFDVGGNSIQLVKLQSAIKRSLHSAPRLVEMMNCGTLGEMARLIDANASSQTIDWAEETSASVLAEDLVKAKALGKANAGVRSDGLSIVLAGASGYLGRNLLARLIDAPEVSQVHCLARDVTSPSLLSLADCSSKVTLATADLSQPNLGLSPEKYASLAEKAHIIINCAANRSFWDGYESLRQVNLEAVKELARLCLANGVGGARPLALHQLSSGAVRVYDDGEDSDGSTTKVQPPTDGTDGYVSSKWAAERFLQNLAASASPAGLDLQLYLHRPTSLPSPTTDSPSSSAIAQDALQELLRITRALGSRPDFTAVDGHVDVAPVADVVGDLVASIVGAAASGASSTGDQAAVRVLEHGARVRVYVETLAEAIASDPELAALPVMNPLYWFRDIKLAGSSRPFTRITAPDPKSYNRPSPTTWVPTFIYQFFVEDAHLRQSVIDFVCKHRPGTNPRLGDPYKFGSYNFNIEIIFDDGIALFRFPIPGVVVYPDDKVTAEVATIRYVADHTTIPVPHIYHWGTAAENLTGLHVPFIIMDHIPHATTLGQALEGPDFIIPSVLESEKREYLYQHMADISLQLYNLTSDRIGSLGMIDSGKYAVTSAPLSHSIAYQVVNCSVPSSVLPTRAKTYSSSTDYLADAIDMEIAGLLFMNEKFIGSATDCRDKFAARCLLRDILRRRQSSSMGGTDRPGPDTDAQTHKPCETFRLWGDDLRPENVLLDEDGAVVGVVDWEYTYFAPGTYSVNPPWWLVLEIMEIYIGEDADSVTLDQEEGGPDAENAETEELYQKFLKHWDELVRTYMRALETEEKKLQDNQQLRPLGKHLCTSSSKDQAGTAPIAQQRSLSQLMRHRWDGDMEEYAITTSMTHTHLFDNYFWNYVDESHWGENTARRHEGRLESLNGPSRMLMEWFVQRRVEEKQIWDPKILLGQVLGQMDGKSSTLVVQDDSS
ncbi:putative Hybrid PKS-NRPS biosynthetic cluster [Diaporthe australafricana]|uniref:Hybrid PKS-NRPS biosynthetic cluster n=1 Tax=Diaporthe australafricana TaxID=127596 RepID=A0ABR3XGX8_9PEZI